MRELANKQVIVIGLGASGRAACDLLRRRAANVLAIDGADTPQLRREAEALRVAGVEVRLGVKQAPADHADLAVISPGVPGESALIRPLIQRGVPVIGELEL